MVGAVAIEVYPLAAPTGRCCCPPRGDGERWSVRAGAWRESLPTPRAHIRRMRLCLPRGAVLSRVLPSLPSALLLNRVEYRAGCARVVGAVATGVYPHGGAHYWKVLPPAAWVCG